MGSLSVTETVENLLKASTPISARFQIKESKIENREFLLCKVVLNRFLLFPKQQIFFKEIIWAADKVRTA